MIPAGTVFLETARPDSENVRTLHFSNPTSVIAAYSVDEVEPALAQIEGWLNRGFWLAGFLEYEAGFAFENIATLHEDGRPLIWLGVYEEPDDDPPYELGQSVAGSQEGGPAAKPVSPTFSLTRSSYGHFLDLIRDHLHEGNVYQINFTSDFRFDWGGSAAELYRILRNRQPVGYNALVVTGQSAVMSCSPELFFRRDGNRIWTRPMKGTVRRGRNEAEDSVLARWLREDEKSRAENVMIVDLLRNDLSRVAAFGSVRTTHLFEPEFYNTVIQLTSTVEAELRPETTYLDLFRALFPCGSVTGAPKVRAMKVISDLETRRRGVYTGAIGYISPQEDAVFSVAIRTVTLSDGVGRMGTGGGIVWDSKPDTEYRECLLKGNFLSGEESKPDLIETMLWDGGIDLLERHLQRLSNSARELRYPFKRESIEGLLREVTADLEGPTRIRLLLHPDGAKSVTMRPCDRPSIAVGPVGVSDIRMDRHDPWLRHKTTRREVYDAEFELAQRRGLVEVVFLNEEGEVTEGSRTNIFIRSDGRLLTPPLYSGVLPGTRRAEILATKSEAGERTLRIDDLIVADEILLCNATTPLTSVTLDEAVNASV